MQIISVASFYQVALICYPFFYLGDQLTFIFFFLLNNIFHSLNYVDIPIFLRVISSISFIIDPCEPFLYDIRQTR